MPQQQTIAQSVRAVGVGLHSGGRVELILKPAPVNTGIVFRRIDLQPAVEIRGDAFAVGDTRLASTLGEGNATVQTVEHLMSACYGLNIDNLYVEITASELPILDGSAAAYVFLLQSANIVQQSSRRRYLRILREVIVSEGEGKQLKWAKLTPYAGFKLTFEILFDHPVVESTGQKTEFVWDVSDYVAEIARARTFCFTRDVEAMRGMGLALGGGLDNAIVMGDYAVLNDDGLRYSDEFAKHKMLDAIGDLYLAGNPLLGHYQAFRSGHGLNNKLLRAVFSDSANYEITEKI